MLKLLLLLFGVGAGAAGASAYYLTEPKDWLPPQGGSPGEGIQQVKTQFLEALAEGKRQGAATENELRNQFDTYRRHPDRPGMAASR